MYEAWQADPASVHASWRAYFGNVAGGAKVGQAFVVPPTTEAAKAAAGALSQQAKPSSDAMGIYELLRGYRQHGHEKASIDPLGLHQWRTYTPPQLSLEYHGFSEAELDRALDLSALRSPGLARMWAEKSKAGEEVTLRSVMRDIENTYLQSTG